MKKVKYIGRHEDGVVAIVNGDEIFCAKGEAVEMPDDVANDLTTNQAVNFEAVVGKATKTAVKAEGDEN